MFFFHLSQAVYQKVQSEGIQSRFQSDADFALSIIPSLAFVLVDNVVTALEQLQENVCHEADPVIDYLDVCISRIRWHNRGN